MRWGRGGPGCSKPDTGTEEAKTPRLTVRTRALTMDLPRGADQATHELGADAVRSGGREAHGLLLKTSYESLQLLPALLTVQAVVTRPPREL